MPENKDRKKQEEFDQVQTVRLKLTRDGRWIFSWMNPLAEDIIKAMGGKKTTSNSRFCG